MLVLLLVTIQPPSPIQASRDIVAATNQHVSDAVLCASQYNLKVQPRSGGHSYGSYGTGGKDGVMVIDLQRFQSVSLDYETNVATFGPGLRLGNLKLELRPTGRALPHGTCANVGAGGHFAIGGDGFTTRAYGLAIDSLLGVDVVLANGSVVHATSTEYKDVFPAGSSFGIATTFYAQTYAYPKTLTGIYLTWPGLPGNTEQSMLKGIYLGPVKTFNKTVLPELLRGLLSPGAGDSDSPTYVKDAIAYPKPGGSGYAPAPDHDNFYTKSITVPAPEPPATAIRNLVALQGDVDNQVLLDSKSGLSAFWRRDTTWVMENSVFTSGPDEVFPVPAGIGLVSDLNRQVTGVLGAGNYGAYQGSDYDVSRKRYHTQQATPGIVA
ncbi:putative glucooligosaccharide oxidase [Diaporthe ampelina]|uniref:Putative glucooligosaccharide oxidase n=1 Tax=Diaporthe ampelina TaxID=1214573 RepID=A0A0G2HWH5_9PEZI|nr:putative glucooligosaccharide oxidase [Diaporthe ampelina]